MLNHNFVRKRILVTKDGMMQFLTHNETLCYKIFFLIFYRKQKKRITSCAAVKKNEQFLIIRYKNFITSTVTGCNRDNTPVNTGSGNNFGRTTLWEYLKRLAGVFTFKLNALWLFRSFYLNTGAILDCAFRLWTYLSANHFLIPR